MANKLLEEDIHSMVVVAKTPTGEGFICFITLKDGVDGMDKYDINIDSYVHSDFIEKGKLFESALENFYNKYPDQLDNEKTLNSLNKLSGKVFETLVGNIHQELERLGIPKNLSEEKQASVAAIASLILRKSLISEKQKDRSITKGLSHIKATPNAIGHLLKLIEIFGAKKLARLREHMADSAYIIQREGIKYILDRSVLNEDGSMTIPKEFVERLASKIEVDYSYLSEEEKTSVRDVSERYILSIIGYVA
jgi:hypothetical protein